MRIHWPAHNRAARIVCKSVCKRRSTPGNIQIKLWNQISKTRQQYECIMWQYSNSSRSISHKTFCCLYSIQFTISLSRKFKPVFPISWCQRANKKKTKQKQIPAFSKLALDRLKVSTNAPIVLGDCRQRGNTTTLIMTSFSAHQRTHVHQCLLSVKGYYMQSRILQAAKQQTTCEYHVPEKEECFTLKTSPIAFWFLSYKCLTVYCGIANHLSRGKPTVLKHVYGWRDVYKFGGHERSFITVFKGYFRE